MEQLKGLLDEILRQFEGLAKQIAMQSSVKFGNFFIQYGSEVELPKHRFYEHDTVVGCH